MRVVLRLILTLAAFHAGLAARAEEKIDVMSGRPGVTVPIYLHVAERPVAGAVLFPGGSGAVHRARRNFLVRAADDFAAAGIMVAVADTPSDHPDGMDRALRASEAQATDAAAIVAFLDSRAAVQVWLVGSSNGSISAPRAGRCRRMASWG